ncbi:MAG: DUF4251 domain-containing protein [Muribaculaceae bacterium]|nr:DUF4251 domain-containing protein [Muribaculaceae bacterium]
MKRLLMTIFAMTAMCMCASAQTIDEVDIETSDNVQLGIITPAEPVQETKEEVKAREKRLRELNDDLAYAKASNSMKRGYFVLLADNIQIGNMGYRHFDINNNSNFLLVQANDGIIQYALNTGSPGANGLGGWTGKGDVRNKRVTVKDNGDVYMRFSVVSSTVNADVDITLFHNSKRAVATISGGPRITMYGEILPYRDNNHR